MDPNYLGLSADTEQLNNLGELFNSLESKYDSIDKNERFTFINSFLNLCKPEDLAHLMTRMDELKRDFLCMLPVEVVEIILEYLDWKNLLTCCQVNKKWNQTITNNFNNIWLRWCLKVLPVDEFTIENFSFDSNFKKIFVDILKDSKLLENGKLFRNWSVGPTEINALGIYQNILATATHIVRFWRLEKKLPNETRTSFPNTFTNNEDKDYEWTCFKRLELMYRAVQLKFDDKYLITTNYFLSAEVYSLSTNQLVQQLSGHSCQITAFNFNSDFMLIVTGSADNTLKFWSIETSDDREMNSESCLITSESNRIWPLTISIVKYDENDDIYLIISLCTHGEIYINSVEKIQDFLPSDKPTTNFETFNFRSNMIFSTKCDLAIDAQFGYNDVLTLSHISYVKYCNKALVAYLVSDNNSQQEVKMYVKKWKLFMKPDNGMIDCEELDIINRSYGFLNETDLRHLGINRKFEILAFGLSYCLFVDETDKIFLSNLKNQTIKCLQKELGLSDKIRIFKTATNVSERFVMSDRKWLDGFEMDGNNSHEIKSVAFAFLTQRVNEAFCTLWNRPANF